LDDKLYYISYNNTERFTTNTDAASPTYTGSTTGGVDKLNSFQTFGNISRLTLDTDLGQFRTGLWLQHSSTRRRQYKMDVGSNTYADLTVVSNIKTDQQFFQNTVQPYAEFEFKVNDKLKITPGLKYNIYQIDMNQFPSAKSCAATNVSGCSSQVNSSATYNDLLPSLEARYFLEKNWNVYGQYAKGDVIPSSSVFDVKGGTVTTPPPPVRTNTVQFGTVYQTPTFMFDFDVYYTSADSSYVKASDGSGGFQYVPSDAVIYKGIEAQANYVLGGGFNLYGNASLLRANYDNAAGLSAASVPNDIETIALMYKKNEINTSIIFKRIGSQWVDSADASTHQFYQLDPIYLTSLNFNYTFNNVSPYVKNVKFKAGIDNLFDKRYIFAYTPGSTTVGSAPGTTTTDTVQLNSGRAVFAGVEARF
jgi:iron complex outermembrane receptor protein